jgi:Beta-1,4-xylanase
VQSEHRKIIVVIILLALLVSACSAFPGQTNTNTSTTTNGTPMATQTQQPVFSFQDIHSLREAAEKSRVRSIAIGAAANIDAFHTDATYKQLLGQEFDMLVPENVLKMYVTHPSIDVFDFSQADELLSFAQQHNMQVEGANLIWSNQVPAWIMQGNYDREELLGIMKDYIMNVVGHYKGKIPAWTVVNEPLDTDESNQTSIWERVIGPDYMDYAFRWAHEADPQAKLYLNEFGVETQSEKTDRYYNLVEGLVKRGVPISGVGFEDHLDITQSYPLPQMVATMQRFAKLGLQVQITEADVMLQNSTAAITKKFQQQAQAYANLIYACQTVKQCNAVIIWGITDRYTWIATLTHHPDQPLLYDDQYRPKPAYNAVKAALFGKQ